MFTKYCIRLEIISGSIEKQSHNSQQKLDIIGTAVIWFSCNVLNHHKKRVEVAILAGNPEREILLSLDCLKNWNLGKVP